jgi:hypothetical protein
MDNEDNYKDKSYSNLMKFINNLDYNLNEKKSLKNDINEHIYSLDYEQRE